MPTLTTEVLDHAERFIAGFEDDAAQEGVEQLLAQLRQAALARRAMLRKLDSLELRGFGVDKRVRFRDNDDTITLEVTDRVGNSVRLHQRLMCPAGWTTAIWNPAHWRLHETRVDNLGRDWSRIGGHYVIDNFGDLVEVAE